MLGIACKVRPRATMEVVDQVAVGVETGIHGDYRGSLKPGRNKRQVTVMAVEAWHAAMADLGLSVAWQMRRVNLLVDGIALEETTGAILTFGNEVVLEITGECDPCSRMEEVAPGLEAALIPHWRGGATAIVRRGGRIATGDNVRIER